MATGTVKFFNIERGFGFITPDAGGPDLFVHATSIEGVGYRKLEVGDRVEYEESQNERGPIAVDVRVI